MKKFVLLAALVLILSYCSNYAKAAERDGWYFEAGAHANVQLGSCTYCWEDNDSPGAYLALRYEEQLTKHTAWLFYYAHDSNWLTGWPLNDESESYHDKVGVGLRIKL